jgi:hypothetical protein
LNLKKLRNSKRSRLGISEVMGAVLMMAVTLAVGFGVWFWASSAASTAEHNFGNQESSNVACLNLNLEIINANFTSTNANRVTVWFFNSGQGAVNISSIQVSNQPIYNLVQSQTNTTGEIAKGAVKSLTLYYSNPFTVSTIYTFQAEARNESASSSTTTTVGTTTTTMTNYAYGCGFATGQYSQVSPSKL